MEFYHNPSHLPTSILLKSSSSQTKRSSASSLRCVMDFVAQEHMSSDSDSDSDSDSNDSAAVALPNFAALSAVLSPEALAALRWHYTGEEETKTVAAAASTPTSASTTTTSTAATATSSSDPVHNMIQQLKAKDAAAEATHQGEMHNKLRESNESQCTNLCAHPLTTPVHQQVEDLLCKGVIRLDGCLSKQLCDNILFDVNQQLNVLEKELCGTRTKEQGFGCVLARKCRYDIYQRPTTAVHDCLRYLLGRKVEEEKETSSVEEQGEASSPSPSSGQVGQLLEQLFETVDSPFTELSVLVSDPGAPRQQLHPDNSFQQVCPLYTVFVALQDITLNMGPTVFLPSTNTKQCHQEFNLKEEEKKEFLQSREWSTSLLKKGDVQILDSMCIHAATANVSDQRRALFYFTVRNPKCVDFGSSTTPKITEGSLFPDVHINLKDYRLQ